MTHSKAPWRDEYQDATRYVRDAYDEIVCSDECYYPAAVSEYDMVLIAAAPELLDALRAITKRYVDLAGSGDCGFWNPEEEPEVIAARAALEKADLKPARERNGQS